MVGLSSVVGGGTLLLFALFLLMNSLHMVKLTLNETAILWFDAGLCLLFFVQHSTMIRRAYQRWLAIIVSPVYHGAVYSVTSGVVLLLLVMLWQESSRMLLEFQGVLRWFMRGVFLLGIAGMAWGIKALDSFDTFGLAPILARVRSKQVKPMPFTVRGPYRWIRHPLYFSMLLLIWSSPDVTADRLLFNTLFTVWIIVATLLEERDLQADFGEVYRNYQRSVPMLIPYRLHPFRMTEKATK
jgi:protein-S-isoprenylcysteine O-methyltransferase Ste14